MATVSTDEPMLQNTKQQASPRPRERTTYFCPRDARELARARL
ncbi:MAG: hypothetical protein ACLR3C_13940 [Eggerthella lenta]